MVERTLNTFHTTTFVRVLELEESSKRNGHIKEKPKDSPLPGRAFDESPMMPLGIHEKRSADRVYAGTNLRASCSPDNEPLESVSAINVRRTL